MHIGGYVAGRCILGDLQQDGVYWGICSRTVHIGGYAAGRCVLLAVKGSATSVAKAPLYILSSNEKQTLSYSLIFLTRNEISPRALLQLGYKMNNSAYLNVFLLLDPNC